MLRLIAIPVLLLALFLFASCSDSSEKSSAGGGKSISGWVTDLAQVPLEGVHVSAYGKSTKTDAAGKFSFSADVPADRAVVDFQKENYFDQSVGKKPSANGSTNVKVVLLPKELAGSVDAATGGKVATSKMRGDFAAKSFVRGDGSEIRGNVRVFAAYVDPDDPGFGNAMPGGDFSAKDGAGDDGVLTSFGALVIEAEEEATGDAAALKQKADICLRIPASMLASAPDSMPVWRLNGGSVWEQTATAQRVGDEYCFFVTVLGAINCDLFMRSALLSGKVCDGSNPARDTEVRIGQLSTQTDDQGEYAVLVSSGVTLTLKTDFGSASAGPLAAGSASSVDVGCSGSTDGGPGCGEQVKNHKAALPGMPEGCAKQCVAAFVSCGETTSCAEMGACQDAFVACNKLCWVCHVFSPPEGDEACTCSLGGQGEAYTCEAAGASCCTTQHGEGSAIFSCHCWDDSDVQIYGGCAGFVATLQQGGGNYSGCDGINVAVCSHKMVPSCPPL